MSPFDFSKLTSDTNLERVCHRVCDEAHSILDDRGAGALTTGQLTAICVETFFGEVCNGGIDQYLDNPSGQTAEFGPDSLRRVGLPHYADILEMALSRCERLEDMIDDWDGQPYRWIGWNRADSLEDLDKRFFALYFADRLEFRRKLHCYIVSNELEFTE
jgi:hypothetical protein